MSDNDQAGAAATAAAPESAKSSRRGSGETVTVACKHPPGIFMRIFAREEYDIPILGGGMKKDSRAIALCDPIKINGPAVPFGQTAPFVISGGYALTPNVPADIALKWMEDNRDSAMVKNKVVFVHAKQAGAVDQAKDQKEVLSGLERLDARMVRKGERMVPRDARWPKATNPNLTVVASDTRVDA